MILTHEAQPVRVNAKQITKVDHLIDKSDPLLTGCRFEFADGSEFQPRVDSGMLSRYVPVVGDYLVTQEDGYEYFNPKDVFERKYRRL